MKRRYFVLLVFTACLLTGCGKTPAEAIPSAETAIASEETAIPTHVQQAPSGKTVSPLPSCIDLTNLEDCTVAVNFGAGDVSQEKDHVMVTLTVYDCELFDIVDMSTLQVGDILHIDGEDIVVQSIEDDGWKRINGGHENGGVTLVSEEDGVYFQIFENKARNYYEVGRITVPVSEEFMFRDGSEPGETEKPKSINDVVEEVNNQGRAFYPHGTKATIINGKLLELQTIYVP